MKYLHLSPSDEEAIDFLTNNEYETDCICLSKSTNTILNNGVFNMIMWIDDLIDPDSNIDTIEDRADEMGFANAEALKNAICNDPEFYGLNPYKYTGSTFNLNGNDYYLWSALNSDILFVKYILTDTINFAYLKQHSLEQDITSTYSPIISILEPDFSEYQVNNIDYYKDYYWLIKIELNN